MWGAESYLIPGVTIRDARLEVGSWCRYLVVDEAAGQFDSTTVYVAVTGKESTAAGDAYWIEMENGPAGAPAADRETVKALILADVKDLTLGDSLCLYIKKLYIKKGMGAVETADPASIERLSLKHPTSDSTWTLSKNAAVFTPIGKFLCIRKHLVVEDNREIPMGRVKLVKKDKDIYDLWLCDDVPVFGLVQSVIERVRDSKTIPRIPGIPDTGTKTSITNVLLLNFGSDAKSIIAID